jgi:TolA-binding protein
VELVPDYANARYFLGLAYDRLNRESDAIAQFEAIQKTNPDNAEVNLILSNLKSGRSAFANAKPPIDDKPEKRAEPPIEEN